MPRSYGRFTTSIWRDPDFTSLSLEQQAVYFTLGLQPDVSAAGLLPYTARRWAKLSSGNTRDRIEALVDSLVEHAGEHLVVDEDTEELLIRKFMKWDLGWANSKRLPVVIDAIRAIASARIRDVALDELRKIADSDMASTEQREAVSRAVSGFDRLRVTEGELLPQPLTATQDPSTATPEREPEPFDGDVEPPAWCSKHPGGTEQPCGPCGSAARRNRAWHRAKPERERRERAERQALIDACGGCDDNGMVLDPDTRKPLGKCNHGHTSLVTTGGSLD